MLFLSGAGIDPATVTDATLARIAPTQIGPRAAEMLPLYRANHPSFAPGQILVRAMTDTMMRYPSIKFAEAHIRGGGATYMYHFTWESAVLPNLGATHGIDTTFYFDTTETVGMAAGNADAEALARSASTAWATFARTGAPAAQGLPSWPQYSLQNRETMILSSEPHIENDPMGADRLLRDRFAA